MSDQEAEYGCFKLTVCAIVGFLSVATFFGVLLSELIHWFNGEGFWPWVP